MFGNNTAASGADLCIREGGFECGSWRSQLVLTAEKYLRCNTAGAQEAFCVVLWATYRSDSQTFPTNESVCYIHGFSASF